MGILCVFCVYDTIGNRCFEKTSFPKMGGGGGETPKPPLDPPLKFTELEISVTVICIHFEGEKTPHIMLKYNCQLVFTNQIISSA